MGYFSEYEGGALTRPIHTREDAENWIRTLHAADMLFHFEDDPTTIIWGKAHEPDAAEIAIINERVAKCYEFDWADLECPIGFALTLDGVG